MSALSITAQERTPSYRIGGVYAVGNLLNDTRPHFSFDHGWGVTAGIGGGRYTLNASVISHKNYGDSSFSGNGSFFAGSASATHKFNSIRAGFDLDVRLRRDGRLRPIITVGAGYAIWKMRDPDSDKILTTIDDNGNATAFTAEELYLSTGVGIEAYPSSKLCLTFRTGLDYLIGLGSSFADSVQDRRGRTPARLSLTLSYLFGGGRKSERLKTEWKSDKEWSQVQEQPRPAKDRDADGDGIFDKHDKCPHTPAGALVDRNGCPADEDADGILNGLDHCPKTPPEAKGLIDIFGCPIDSDYDGISDYRDSCRLSPVGAAVDSTGCPIDSDGDGVADGLDDCPGTQSGLPVDKRGCLDMSFLKEPYRLYIDYKPGSFEVDDRTKERLMPLVRKLLILTDINFMINAYTDNVGTPDANLALSQKRANRLRDWFVSQGIVSERITPVGKGENGFVASNDTAEGRALNRRLELVFSKRK